MSKMTILAAIISVLMFLGGFTIGGASNAVMYTTEIVALKKDISELREQLAALGGEHDKLGQECATTINDLVTREFLLSVEEVPWYRKLW